MTDPTKIRCWQCGAEPYDVFEITRLGDPEPRYIPGRWPAGDHEHAVDPPTADELIERGQRAVDRIIEEWTK